MTLGNGCKQGHHDHDLDVEFLSQEHSLLVQHTDEDCDSALVAVLGYGF